MSGARWRCDKGASHFPLSFLPAASSSLTLEQNRSGTCDSCSSSFNYETKISSVIVVEGNFQRVPPPPLVPHCQSQGVTFLLLGGFRVHLRG